MDSSRLPGRPRRLVKLVAFLLDDIILSQQVLVSLVRVLGFERVLGVLELVINDLVRVLLALLVHLVHLQDVI